MRVEEIEREEFLELQTTGDITDIDYEELPSKTFETQLEKVELEMLGKEFNDGAGFFTSKLDVEALFKDTPAYDLKMYQASNPAASSITTQATSNLGASYSYGNPALLGRS